MIEYTVTVNVSVSFYQQLREQADLLMKKYFLEETEMFRLVSV